MSKVSEMTPATLPKLNHKKPVVGSVSVTLGCDPELFFQTKDGVVGAEKVIGTQGLMGANTGTSKLVLDGVQAELHPGPSTCRQTLSANIAAGMVAMRDHLAKMDGVTACFSTVVEVSKKELASLSEAARVLGCAPSLNAYEGANTIKVDATKYRKRSAGGHIHLGMSIPSVVGPGGDPKRIVNMLDIFLGNTCVMLDRDPLASERRQVYGKAGEFRLPPHGLEYRTLSNFWLRSYPLTSMVMSLARFAPQVVASYAYMRRSYTQQNPNTYGYDLTFNPEEKLLKMVDLEKVRRAINTNDLALAKENWAVVKEFVSEHVNTLPFYYGSASLPMWDKFLAKVEERGLEYWFPDDPLTHWCKVAGKGSTNVLGWEGFLHNTVLNDGTKGYEAVSQ